MAVPAAWMTKSRFKPGQDGFLEPKKLGQECLRLAQKKSTWAWRMEEKKKKKKNENRNHQPNISHPGLNSRFPINRSVEEEGDEPWPFSSSGRGNRTGWTVELNRPVEKPLICTMCGGGRPHGRANPRGGILFV